MLTPHRGRSRSADVSPEAPVWFSLYGDDSQPDLPSSSEPLTLLEEGRFAPRAKLRERICAAEVLTYVREGALAYDDSTGRVGVVRAGEFQRMSLGPGQRYSEVNASSNDWAYAYQIWLGAGGTFEPGHERRRFSIAQRRGRLCAVASPDAREGSLLLQQDAVVYSSILGRGQHVVHVLDSSRRAWLHVVEGVVRVGPTLLLHAGDGLTIVAEPVLSLTAQEETELLIIDVTTRPDPGALGPRSVRGVPH